jgi:SRSO17 transposase
VFLDRELYLPEAWARDRVRRAEAHVPQEVRFATKSEQAIAMLEQAWEHGVPMRWVTGDEVYGDAPRLRETIQAHGRFYVLAVSANMRVWTERPEVEEPQEQTGGRPRRAARVAKGATRARMVSEVIADLPRSAWKRLAVVEGEKGMITYHWARVRVVESREQLPGPAVWLLARRSPSTPDKLAYYLAKGETGLDEYEVRFWHSWYRHITLSMMAHAWLASIKRREQGKKASQPMSLPD